MNITPRSAPVANSVIATPSADEPASNELTDGQDLYTALSQLIAEVSGDHTQLRYLIYEFARAKLRRELYPRFLEGAWSEIEQQLLGLERTIVRVEADFAPTALPLESTAFLPSPSWGRSFRFSNSQRTTALGTSAIHAESLLLGGPQNASLSLHNPNSRSGNSFLGKHLRSRFWRITQLLIATAIGLAI